MSSGHVLSGNQFGQVKLWDIRSPESFCSNSLSLSDPTSSILSLAQHPGRTHLILGGCSDGNLSLWDLRQSSTPLSFIPRHNGPIWSVCNILFSKLLLTKMGFYWPLSKFIINPNQSIVRMLSGRISIIWTLDTTEKRKQKSWAEFKWGKYQRNKILKIGFWTRKNTGYWFELGRISWGLLEKISFSCSPENLTQFRWKIGPGKIFQSKFRVFRPRIFCQNAANFFQTFYFSKNIFFHNI